MPQHFREKVMVAKLLRLCLLGVLLSACSSLTIPGFSSDEAASSQKIAPTTPTASTKAPNQIALLLPTAGDLSKAGKAVEAGFRDAYQNAPSKPVIKIYDESQYEQAIKEGANMVVGPLDKNKVATLEKSGDIKVITIALNNPETSSATTNLYEFSLSPTDEATQIADRATHDGYQSALMIVPEGAWGQKIASALQSEWEKNGGTIVGNTTISNAQDINAAIRDLLEVQGNSRRQDFDVIFLVVQPAFARQIKPYLKFYHAENVPVYGTSLIYTGLMNMGKDNDLNGVIFCDMPLVLDQAGKWAEVRQLLQVNQPMAVQQYIRLYGLGWDAALLTQNFGALDQGVNGATGNLYKNTQNAILRKLTFAVFDNGVPKPLS
jgi:outer membrane PBP1 activator LpoA protein